MLNLAEVLAEAGLVEEATVANATVAEVFKTIGDVPPSTMLQAQRARAKLAVAARRWPEAVVRARQASAYSNAAFGQAHPDSATTLLVLATALEGAGQYAQAVSSLETYLSMVKGLSLDGNADSVRARVRCGESLLGLKRPGEAAARFEEALQLLEQLEGNERLRVEARFGLAQALVAKDPRGERSRPVALAEQARAAAMAQGRADEADRIGRWLMTNRGH